LKLITVSIFLLSIATCVASSAQTYTTLASFDGTNGRVPQGQLVQGRDGNFYGTTVEGGAGSGADCNANCGTVFKVTTGGKITALHQFCTQTGCPDGNSPQAGLIQATDGNFYGTTIGGGKAGHGTVFKITSAGDLTTLYNFCSQPNCTDGDYPTAGLVQGTDGNFYGTTATGGVYLGTSVICATIIFNGNFGCGTVFKLTPKGELTTLYNFCSKSNCTDGYQPLAGLLQATDGNFYGTAYGGGGGGGGGVNCESDCGTIFKITPQGTLTTVYNFCSKPDCADGAYPSSNVIQAKDGNFYGTSYRGNTVFKLSPAGKLTTLYNFCSQPECADGLGPAAALMQATDGNFYGTTEDGGTGGNNGSGVVFKITAEGAFTTLYSFCSKPDCVDGSDGFAGLTQGTNGTIYGAAALGGSSDYGVIFSLSMGLGPFVETQTSSAKVGATVYILGNNLTGATKVSFDGTPATIALDTSSAIATKVPAGAATGTLTVTTPSGTLRGNLPFRVTPQLDVFSPLMGPVGTQVQITGVSLTQTRAVTFGGVRATEVSIDSDTQVTATVPADAKSGPITITTAGGTATTEASFDVTE
jgi:uncharacterized repeat protein (TIGR03803 family)